MLACAGPCACARIRTLQSNNLGPCRGRAWRGSGEHPFLLDNLWDLRILIDYLASRPDVDAARIGCTGVSLGGMHTWLLAALDARIACAAPLIGVQACTCLCTAASALTLVASLELRVAHSAPAPNWHVGRCQNWRVPSLCRPVCLRAGAAHCLHGWRPGNCVTTDAQADYAAKMCIRYDMHQICRPPRALLVQNFGWAVHHNAFHARVGSIPAVFAAAAVDLGYSSVTAEVVRAVWDKLLPGLLTVRSTQDFKQSIPVHSLFTHSICVTAVQRRICGGLVVWI